MAAGDLALTILLRANDQASPIIGDLGRTISNFASGSGPLGAVVGVAAGAAAAIVGVGAESVKSAADFQQSMLKVGAYAGLSKQQMDSMNNSILQMASNLGQSPKAMADAIYPIISSGYTASQALNILGLSAKTAAASGAQMSTVADMLTTALKASAAPASDAGHYMDMFNKIVSLGKGEVPAYAATIGKLSLAAASAHIPFDQMGAALATLTTHGFPSVAQASTALGNLFTQIGPKVDALAAHAKALGLKFDENKFKTMDLYHQLQYLEQVTHGNQGELLKLLGGSTLALKAFNALTGSAKDFATNLDAMKNSAGATDAAFQAASSGFNASMARMQASIEVLKIKIGQALLPALTSITNKIAPLITAAANWIEKNHVVENSIGAVSTVLSTIGAILAPVVKFIQNMVSAVTSGTGAFGNMQPILKQIGDFLVATFKPVWDQLVDTWQTQVVPAWNDLMKALGPAMPALQLIGKLLLGLIVLSLVAFIKGLALVLQGLIPIFSDIIVWTAKFVQAILWIVTQCQPAIDAIVNAFQWLYDTLVGHSIIPDLISAIQSWFAKLPALLLAIMQQVKNTLVSAWNTVVNDVKAAWQKISTVFSSAWQAYVAGSLTTFFTNLKNWFTANVVNQFGTWATNAMKMFAQNITAGITSVTTAVTGVANTIKKLLGFASPPQAGPLATSDQWMPNMMTMLAHGITSNTPQVTGAMNNLALNISSKFSGLNTTVSTSTNNINNQLMLLSSNVQTQTGNVSSQFSTLSSNVGTSVNNITTQFAGLNTQVSQSGSAISSSAQQASSSVQSASSQIGSSTQQAAQQVGQATSTIQTHFGQTSQYATQTVQAVSQAGQQANQQWSKAMSQLQGAYEQAAKGLIAMASGDGEKAGHAFYDGFQHLAQAAQAAAASAANYIASLLGHSKPKAGPLRDDDQWGKHMVENIVGGMTGSMPLVFSATDALANALSGGGRISSSVTPSARSVTPGNQPIIIHNYTILDGKQVGKSVTRWQQRELRVQGVIRGA